jgi:hypothetical protein
LAERYPISSDFDGHANLLSRGENKIAKFVKFAKFESACYFKLRTEKSIELNVLSLFLGSLFIDNIRYVGYREK